MKGYNKDCYNMLLFCKINNSCDLKTIAYILTILVFFTFLIFTGCKSKKIVMKPEPEKNVNTANQEGTTMDYDEAVKRHFEMQSERTQRMIIESEKKRKRRNSGLNREWYDQLFNNSCMNNSKMVKTGHSYNTVTNNSSCFIKK